MTIKKNPELGFWKSKRLKKGLKIQQWNINGIFSYI